MSSKSPVYLILAINLLVTSISTFKSTNTNNNFKSLGNSLEQICHSQAGFSGLVICLINLARTQPHYSSLVLKIGRFLDK